LYLGIDEILTKSQIDYKFLNVIEKAACEAYGTPLKIRFLLPGEKPPPQSAEKPSPKKMKDPTDSLDVGKIFNPRYTFTNFIEGPTNQFAKMAAQKVAESPGDQKYSPLFIYGKSGLGKTHLLNAIGLYILTHSPELEILYVSSEQFMDDYVDASLEASRGKGSTAF
jgi:chromosomal replication initiator protein